MPQNFFHSLCTIPVPNYLSLFVCFIFHFSIGIFRSYLSHSLSLALCFTIDAYIISFTVKTKSVAYREWKKYFTKDECQSKTLLFLFSSTDKHKFIVLLNAVDVEIKYYDLLYVACFNDCCGRVLLLSLSIVCITLALHSRDDTDFIFTNFSICCSVILFWLRFFFALIRSYSVYATYFVNMYVLFIEFFRDQMIVPFFLSTFY